MKDRQDERWVFLIFNDNDSGTLSNHLGNGWFCGS